MDIGLDAPSILVVLPCCENALVSYCVARSFGCEVCVASVCFIAANQPHLSTPEKFHAYALQNDTSLLQGHNKQRP